MTTATAPQPEDGFPRTATESHDSVLVEFTDADADFTPRPPRDAVLRHLPSGLRDSLKTRAVRPTPQPASPALAACLLDQARLLARLRRYAEAAPRAAEAEQLLTAAGDPAALADCLHVAADVHAGLGEHDKALDCLRREEDLRRRLAA